MKENGAGAGSSATPARLKKRRRVRADELLVARRRAAEDVERRKEQMQAQIERVLLLSRALAAAHP